MLRTVCVCVCAIRVRYKQIVFKIRSRLRLIIVDYLHVNVKMIIHGYYLKKPLSRVLSLSLTLFLFRAKSVRDECSAPDDVFVALLRLQFMAVR